MNFDLGIRINRAASTSLSLTWHLVAVATPRPGSNSLNLWTFVLVIIVWQKLAFALFLPKLLVLLLGDRDQFLIMNSNSKHNGEEPFSLSASRVRSVRQTKLRRPQEERKECSFVARFPVFLPRNLTLRQLDTVWRQFVCRPCQMQQQCSGSAVLIRPIRECAL